jgi:cell division protein FtsN
MTLQALRRAVLPMVVILALAGCSRERIDWKSAEAADTQEGYNHFLQRHPDSALATQARTRIAQLAEDKDWQRASAADTADAYQQFLAQHASGKWAEEARIRIENFSLDANPSPSQVLRADSAAAVSTPADGTASVPRPVADAATSKVAPETPPPSSAAPPPPGPPSKPAPVAQSSSRVPAASATPHEESASRPKATTTTGPASKPVTTTSSESSTAFGIQLGAFSTQAKALSEWKRLQTNYDIELHGLFAHAVPVQVTSGTLFRLQAPVGDESRARSICASLTKHSQPCVVVIPPKS